MPVQRALRLARRAGGEDHQRGIVRRGVDRREIAGCARDRLGETQRALARPVDRQDERERRQLIANLAQLGEPLRIGDDRLHAGIPQPVAQRIDAEQDRERHRDRAELVDRDVSGGGFRCLRQQHRDAIAARDPVGDKRIGEAVRGFAQPTEGDRLVRAVRAHVEDREPVGLACRPFVADVDADVVAVELRPAEFRVELVVIVDGRKHGKVPAGAAKLVRLRASRNTGD